MSSDIILDVRKLEKNYNTTTHEGKETIYSVLKGISFQVHKGEFISIMGSSGCGKTTLLKIIGMLSEPSKGTVLYKADRRTDRSQQKHACTDRERDCQSLSWRTRKGHKWTSNRISGVDTAAPGRLSPCNSTGTAADQRAGRAIPGMDLSAV